MAALLHWIISPKSHVPKVYEATLANDMRGDEAATLASGTLLLESETTPLLLAELEVYEPRKARLTLREGCGLRKPLCRSRQQLGNPSARRQQGLRAAL